MVKRYSLFLFSFVTLLVGMLAVAPDYAKGQTTTSYPVSVSSVTNASSPSERLQLMPGKVTYLSVAINRGTYAGDVGILVRAFGPIPTNNSQRFTTLKQIG